MKLFIFARFHARAGQEDALEALLRAQPELVRAEPGCLEMGNYRSMRDPRLFWIHSRWADEAAFNLRRPAQHRPLHRARGTADRSPARRDAIVQFGGGSLGQKLAAARSPAKAAKISSNPSLRAATAASMSWPEVGFSAV